MKKLLMGAATGLLLSLGAVSQASADYAAIAVGVGGWAFSPGHSTMEGARAAARRRCQNGGYGSCSTTTAERSNWYFSGGWCNGMSVPYSAASKHSWAQANAGLRQKGARDGYYDCVIQANE